MVAIGMVIDDAHVTQLMTALQALYAGNGWSAPSWGSILPAGTAVPAAGIPISAPHIAALRDKMEIALAALGVASGTYADDPLRSGVTVIRAAHITALQQRAQ